MEIRAAVAGIAASVLAFIWAGETAQAQAPPPEPTGPIFEIISLWAGDAQANDPSKSPSVSDDGRYVVFLSKSTATTFPGDTFGGQQVCFLRDRIAGTTVPISLYGDTPFQRVRGCVISGNGKFAAFAADARGFLPIDDVFSLRDVFWRDLETGTVVLITRRSDGNAGGGENPSISDDGQRVAFEANCNWLLDINDPSEFPNICVWDTGGGITQISNPIRPSIIWAPFPSDEVDGASISPAISGDGNWVAFASNACNLVGDGTCFLPDGGGTRLYEIYVASSVGGGAKLVSAGSGGVAGNGLSGLPAISDDGSTVAFGSWADNFDLNDSNGRSDIFVKDVGSGVLNMVSVGEDGSRPDLGSARAAVNGDGKLIAFASQARTIHPSATSGQWQIYLRDHTNNKTHLVSAEPGGDPGLWSSTEPAIDDSGKWVAFSTREPFVGGDTNNTDDIYLRDMGDLQGPAAALRVLPNPVAIDAPILITGLIDDSSRGDGTIAKAEYAILRCFIVGCSPAPSDWLPIAAPDDGFFDDSTEAVTVVVDPGIADAGPYEVCLRGTDSLGNRGGSFCLRLTVLAIEDDTDSDGDAIIDLWETDETNVMGLAAMGADRLRKDIFVEIDCIALDGNGDGDLMDPEDHTHCPREASIRKAVQAFADAPVSNPDGTTGIQLHVDVGNIYGSLEPVLVEGTGGVVGSYGDYGEGGDLIPEPGNEVVDWDGDVGKPGIALNQLKKDYFNFDRAPAFHYAIFAHQVNLRARSGFIGDTDDTFYRDQDSCETGGGEQTCTAGFGSDCTSGWAERFTNIGGSTSFFKDNDLFTEIPIPNRVANDFIISLGGQENSGADCRDSTSADFSNLETGTFMHELGHNLGIGHGGADETHRKPNYLSIMNYAFQNCDVPSSPEVGLPGSCDLSRFKFPTLDETDLDECAGVDQDSLKLCVVKVGGIFDSINEGDDILDGEVIRAGPNGLCESPAIADDIAVSDEACVLAGVDEVFESNPSGDDVVVGLQILSGPDGICQSTISGSNVCILKGANFVLDTEPEGDDKLGYYTISAGTNDLCETLVPAFDDTLADDIDLNAFRSRNLGAMDWDGDGTFEGLSCPPPNFSADWSNSNNVSADINNDSICINPGSNGKIDSLRAGDDIKMNEVIFVGLNRECETEKLGDDVFPGSPTRKVGFKEPKLLHGYDDWNNLQFNFKGFPTYDADAAADASPDVEALENAQAFFASMIVPELQIVLTGPSEAQTGSSATYTADLLNVGGGPAVGGPAIARVDGAIVTEFGFDPIKAGILTQISFQHTFASGAIGQTLTVELEIQYSGFFGGDFMRSATTNTLVTGGGGENLAPTANAGPDQTVEATSLSSTSVVLDGSGSGDLDNDPLTYLWSWGALNTTVGVSPNVVLPLGTNNVSLVVNDGKVDSASDMTQITVVDTTPPTISVSCAQTVALDSTEVATVLVTDGVSGVKSQSHTNGGHALDTATAGAKTFPVTAEDNAGNSGGGSCGYTVLGSGYDFVGFLAPVDNLPLINTAKAGQSIAMKWQVGDGQGGYISDPGIVASTRYALVACPNEGETVEELMEADDSGDSGLRFDDTDQQFRYVWKTSKSLGGRCAEFILTLDDNSAYRASFAFR